MERHASDRAENPDDYERSTFQNVARDSAQVGAQVGQIKGSAHFETRNTSDVVPREVGAILADIRAELARAVQRQELDAETAEAVSAEVDAADAVLRSDTAGTLRSRAVVALKKAKGLVEGLAGLTSKVVEAIQAIQGLR